MVEAYTIITATIVYKGVNGDSLEAVTMYSSTHLISVPVRRPHQNRKYIFLEGILILLLYHPHPYKIICKAMILLKKDYRF
jgi:hypothetical protein